MSSLQYCWNCEYFGHQRNQHNILLKYSLPLLFYVILFQLRRGFTNLSQRVNIDPPRALFLSNYV